MKPYTRVLVGYLIAGTFLGYESKTSGPEPTVEITAFKQYYCLGRPGGDGVPERLPPDAITLRLRIRLSYRNVGSRPLILPLLKGLTALVISPTRAGATRRQSERVVPYFGRMIPEDLSQEGDQPTLNHNFEVIPPGGVFERRFSRETDFDEYVILDVRNPAGKFQRDDLRGKKIFLQLELNHLRFPKSQADELAVRWERYGYLWTGTVRSNPVEINIPRSPEFADCSHEYKID